MVCNIEKRHNIRKTDTSATKLAKMDSNDYKELLDSITEDGFIVVKGEIYSNGEYGKSERRVLERSKVSYNQETSEFLYGNTAIAAIGKNTTLRVPELLKVLHSDKDYRNKIIMSSGASNKRYASDAAIKDIISEHYEEVVGLTNNPARMKEFIKKLRDTDSASISDEHFKTLENVIDKFVGGIGQTIPDLIVKLDKAIDQNGGFIDLDKKEISIFRGAPNSAKSMPEVYVHEYLHGVFELGEKTESVEYKELMYEVGLEQVKITSTLDAKLLSEYGEISITEAQKILDYISNTKTGTKEFAVMALTNEPLIKAIDKLSRESNKLGLIDGKTWFDKLLVKVIEMYENILHRLGKRVGSHKKHREVITEHLLALSKLNDRASIESNVNIVNKAGEVFDYLDDKAGTVLAKLGAKWKDEGLEKPELYSEIVNAKGFKKWWLLGKNMKYIGQNRTTGKMLRLLMAEALQLKPEGSIQMIVKHMSKGTSLERQVEQLINLSSHIDQQKENRGNTVRTIIRGAFNNKKLKTEQLEIMKEVILDNDLRVLREEGDKYIRDILSNVNYRQAEINKISEQLSDWSVGQAKGLGWFMVSGKSNRDQLKNAESIDSKNIELVDKLATLYSIEYGNQEKNQEFVKLMDSEQDAINNIMGLADEFVRESKKLYSKYTFVKGYTKKNYREDLDLKYVSSKDRKKLLAQGYKQVGVQYRNAVDPYRGGEDGKGYNKIYLMVSGVGAASRYIKTSMRLTDHTVKHVDIYADKAKIKTTTVNDKRISKKDYDPRTAVTQAINAVYDNETGMLRGYNYGVPKELIAKHKTPLNSIVGTLSSMFTELKDQTETIDNNKKVLAVMVQDAITNIGLKDDGLWNSAGVSKNIEKYYMLEKDSSNKELKDLYNVLPSSVKKYLIDNHGGKIPVRANLMYDFLGSRKLSLADNIRDKESVMIYKRAIKVAEAVWQEIVAIAKSDIVIRTPAVLIGNVVSNTVLGLVEGVPPWKMLQLQLEGLKYLSEYVKLNKEMDRLLLISKTGNISSTQLNRMKTLKTALENSPIAGLVAQGHFSPIVEDLGDVEANAGSKIKGYFDQKAESLPDWLETAANYTYLSSKTAPFRFMTKATQYSDFIAKYAVQKVMRENGPSKTFMATRTEDKFVEHEKKMNFKFGLNLSLDIALGKPNKDKYNKWVKQEWDHYVNNTITSSFIHYGSADGRKIQYLNDMGLIMFTKYFNRIQKVIKNATLEHPLRTVAALFSEYVFLGDVDTIWDQQFMFKDLSNSFHTPLDTVEHLLTPTMYELLTGQLKV